MEVGKLIQSLPVHMLVLQQLFVDCHQALLSFLEPHVAVRGFVRLGRKLPDRCQSSGRSGFALLERVFLGAELLNTCSVRGCAATLSG